MYRRALGLFVALFFVVPLAAADKQLDIKPSEAETLLADLKKVSGVEPAPAKDEVALFKHAADGTLDRVTVAEAALLASGVTDAAKRKAYLAQLDRIETDARKAVAGTESPREKGERLLKFLHDGPMAGEYEAERTTLADVLDTRKFNCVSSTVIYNLIAERLGLETRAIEAPGVGLSGHVFAVLRADGLLIDVETTNKLGFNPEGKRARPDGVAFDPDKDDRRLLDARQLAAVIYYNRAVTLSEAGKSHEAIEMSLRALHLDPSNGSAVNNVLAGINNWALQLSEKGKYEDAIFVLTTGRRLAAEDSSLNNNLKVVWQDYAHARMSAGKTDEALAVAARAAKEAMGSDLTELPARLFLRPGEKLVEQGKWQEAIALADDGLPKIDGEAQQELRRWRGDLFLGWSDKHRKAGDWDGAYTALEKGQADDRNNESYDDRISFCAQEQLAEAAKKSEESVKDVVAQLRKRFPKNKGVAEMIGKFASRQVYSLVEAGKYEAALKELDRRKDWVGDTDKVNELGSYVYHHWAQSLKTKDWKKALEFLGRGNKEYPSSDLEEMASAVCDGQGFPLLKAKKFDQAVGFYEEGLKHFPESTFLQERVKLCKK